VSAGRGVSCAVTRAGGAYCWGNSSTTPVAVAPSLTFAALSAGDAQHVCGITRAGVAYCWGNGPGGELGNGTTGFSAVPVPVSQ
jgi:alpha-tubulin suppressor-like RCC1 family protein